jgi:hypothetical protein
MNYRGQFDKNNRSLYETGGQENPLQTDATSQIIARGITVRGQHLKNLKRHLM